MPLATRVRTFGITSPTAFTETETTYEIIPPGLPVDCTGLPLVTVLGDLLLQGPHTLLGFRGADASPAGKPYFRRNGGGNSKWMGRCVKYYPATDAGYRVGKTIEAGIGLRHERMQLDGTQTRIGMCDPAAMNSSLQRILQSPNFVTYIQVPKSTGEYWELGTRIIKKTDAGGTFIYTNDLTSIAGFVRVEAVGLSATKSELADTGFIQTPQSGDADLFFQPANHFGIEDAVRRTDAPTGLVTFGGQVFRTVDGAAWGPFSVANKIVIPYGTLMAWDQGVYTIRFTSPRAPGSEAELIQAYAGWQQFTLMGIPARSDEFNPPTYLPIGNGRGDVWCSRILARSFTNEITDVFTAAGQIVGPNPFFDRLWRTRKYLRAPILFGSCDGGDFALDCSVPAPFGDCRVVWSPVQKSLGKYLFATSDTDYDTNLSGGSIIDRPVTDYTATSNFNLFGERGICIYEPVLVEKVATAAAVPANYSPSYKRRHKGMVRFGTTAIGGSLFKKENKAYGGGSWDPFEDGFIPNNSPTLEESGNNLVDLSTIPAGVQVSVYYYQNAGRPALPPSPSVGWALWDAVAKRFELSGAPAASTFVSTAIYGSYNVNRYTVTMPTPPSGNRQAVVRAYVDFPGFVSGCGFPFNRRFLMDPGGGVNLITCALMTAPTPTRRQVWPWLVSANRVIGSDATVTAAENLGAVWDDPYPSPAISSSGDWTLSWVGNRLRFTGMPAWVVTNLAASPEARLLECDPYDTVTIYRIPAFTRYRVKVVGIDPHFLLWTVPTASAQGVTRADVWWETTNFQSWLPSGTEIEVEIHQPVQWRTYPSRKGILERVEAYASGEVAYVYRRSYRVTIP